MSLPQQTPKTGCAYFRDENFKNTGCIMDAGLLALIKFPDLGFEKAIKEKYEQFKQWETTKSDDNLLKGWINLESNLVDNRWLSSFRSKNIDAINKHGELIEILHKTINTNRAGMPCQDTDLTRINNIFNDLNIKTSIDGKGYADNIEFIKHIIDRFGIKLSTGANDSFDKFNFAMLSYDEPNKQVDIANMIDENKNNPDMDVKVTHSSLYIIVTPRHNDNNKSDVTQWSRKIVIAPQSLKPFKEPNQNKEMRLIGIIAIDSRDDAEKALNQSLDSKTTFSVYILNPCDGTDQQETWYRWDTDNSTKSIYTGKKITDNVRVSLSTKGYIWLYAPSEDVNKYNPIINMNQSPQPQAQPQTQQTQQQTQQQAQQQAQQAQQQTQQNLVIKTETSSTQLPSVTQTLQSQQPRLLYISEAKRNDIIKDIIESPPNSFGLEEYSSVETIQCAEVCDVIKYAIPSNAVPAEIIKSDTIKKGIAYYAKRVVGMSTQNVNVNTVPVYSIPSHAKRSIGTLVMIMHDKKIFGTFLKIKKDDQFIKINDAIDFDPQSENTIYVKGAGKFTIRGLVIH